MARTDESSSMWRSSPRGWPASSLTSLVEPPRRGRTSRCGPSLWECSDASMQLGRRLAEQLCGAAFQLEQFAGRHGVAAAHRVHLDTELDLARAVAQNAHREFIVWTRSGNAMGCNVVPLVAHIADLSAGQVEFCLRGHLVLAQFVDDGDWKLQVHGRCSHFEMGV